MRVGQASALLEKKTFSNPAFQENQTAVGIQKTGFCPLKRSYPPPADTYYRMPNLHLTKLYYLLYYLQYYEYLVEYKKNGEVKKTIKTTA